LSETINLSKDDGYNKSKMANRYSPEARTRVGRMVFEHQGSHETQAGAIAAISSMTAAIRPRRYRLTTTSYRHAQSDAFDLCNGYVLENDCLTHPDQATFKPVQSSWQCPFSSSSDLRNQTHCHSQRARQNPRYAETRRAHLS
ncbi:unnamed protein product, partial [Ectocarpus sp. 8 AP-2014]